MTVFIRGKQKRVPRPQLIDGLDPDDWIRRNADPIWLVQTEQWELLPIERNAVSFEDDECPFPDGRVPDINDEGLLDHHPFDDCDLSEVPF